ncbi:ABC transporter ATP-binding protein [Frisingicoccus sp.]|uniref:ABC transporter ATP-binding protein n=1 Tax=Frisingicoccus sp. TaxID=1918627 RepID=UPI0015BC1081|nr:ATP-binding cassette domain-containing protein [Frisingicoccus sp.]MEE0753026.1 ABC transporter ATP-binding protein [Frisingicoccus sp.]
MAILEMKNISKAFSGVYANENVNLAVEKGEIHALLGENGAGKTTLMNILFGIYTADSGEIYWKDKKVEFDSPREAIEQGIGMVHQHFSLVQKMTVLDNIILGLKQEGLFLSRMEARKSIVELAEKYGLLVRPDARIRDLSVGEQQRVEILKALYRNVDLLILDEPTGVLTPKETQDFFEVLRRLKSEGYAVIIITHRMSEIMAISDRVTILRDGKKIKDLVTSETNPTELSMYMIGRELQESFEIQKQQGSEIALELKDVHVAKGEKAILDHVNMTVRKGEVLGIAGVDGNGQTELAEVIAGIRKITSGDICFMNENIQKDSVKQRFEKGISYISDDRHADGLVIDMSLKDNMLLKHYDKEPYSKKGIFNKKPMDDLADSAIEKFQIKTTGTSGKESIVKLLSGGNQQKIIIAREVTEDAKLVIANQPTRGLDIGATEFVRQTLMDVRNSNRSVLLISADLEEILALSDRIAVMFGGRIVGVLNRDEADVQKIGLLMGGVTKEAMQ